CAQPCTALATARALDDPAALHRQLVFERRLVRAVQQPLRPREGRQGSLEQLTGERMCPRDGVFGGNASDEAEGQGLRRIDRRIEGRDLECACEADESWQGECAAAIDAQS